MGWEVPHRAYTLIRRFCQVDYSEGALAKQVLQLIEGVDVGADHIAAHGLLPHVEFILVNRDEPYSFLAGVLADLEREARHSIQLLGLRGIKY